MSRLHQAARGVLIGGVLWTATEYSVHRWLMHGRRGTNPLSAEHLDHHARPSRTFSLAFDRGLLWKAASIPIVGWPVAALAGAPTGAAAGLSFAAGYAGYTHTHHVVHHRAPATSAGRWLRKHHLAHHFATPRRNYGVTHGWWDVVLGTASTPDVVVVPRRLAPVWLVDGSGALRPEYADDYRLAGRTPRPVDTADLEAALADTVPAAD